MSTKQVFWIRSSRATGSYLPYRTYKYRSGTYRPRVFLVYHIRTQGIFGWTWSLKAQPFLPFVTLSL